MTDYNDGKWHGWNGGGEKPDSIHPETYLDIWDARDGVGELRGIPAKCVHWEFSGTFRVVEEYKEPREFWIAVDSYGRVIDILREKPSDTTDHFLVREVLE